MDCFLSEADVKTAILAAARPHEPQAQVYTVKRDIGKGTVNRTVTFAVRVSEGNEALVNALISLSLRSHPALYVRGSEVNLQNGEMAIDYIYVVATVAPQLTP